MPITLFDKPECPFCWKVRIAIAELGLEVETINYLAPGQEDIWRKLTPNTTVPVLVTPEGTIYESDVIMEYLSDLSGTLLPVDLPERIKARLLHKYSDTKIGAGLREVIFEKRGKPEGEWDQERIRKGIKLFHQALPFLEDKLTDQPYFTRCYSLPEAALTARFALAEHYGVEIPSEFPKLKNWFKRMKSRPSFELTSPW
ncbi:MAG: glutathione S-transferase family protein [Neptuniibacter sp.]